MAAYFIVAWLLLQVASVTFPPLGLPEWSQRVMIIALAAGTVPAFVLAWIYDFTGRGLVRTDPMAPESAPGADPPSRDVRQLPPAALADTGVDPVHYAAPSARGAGTSIAVLPFADLSQAKDQDWFCDGLAEEIIDALCCVRGLRVASRTASFRYRDGSVDPREIGRQMHVGTVLEGSVRKQGERVRVTAQLIDAGNGYHLWSETYDRRLEDIFAIQTEIARKVSASLQLTLSVEADQRCERYAPKDMRAHEFYLRGRQLIRNISTADWLQAPAMFRRAIEIDPGYAQAHAGLADILAQLILWRFVPPDQDLLPEAKRAAHRALELAPDLAEAHVALGHLRSLAGNIEGATESFQRALELNPELFEAYYYFARHMLAQGLHARAAELFLQAFEKRPDDHTVLPLAVSELDAADQHERALEIAHQAVAGLRHQVELNPEDARAHYMLSGVLARIGEIEEGNRHTEIALALRPNDYATLYNAACYYSLSGNTERALELLEGAVVSGQGSWGWIAHDGDLKSLHGHPRFQALLATLE
jgi:adenylate cyclase